MFSSQKCVSGYLIVIDANKHCKTAQDNPIATALIDISVAYWLPSNGGCANTDPVDNSRIFKTSFCKVGQFLWLTFFFAFILVDLAI